ncbi:MAG: hypothetical protein K6T31_03500, partial [Alicyclobacillus sp.]|nr:hypothetical protein [Alicyclobacillus sp.]
MRSFDTGSGQDRGAALLSVMALIFILTVALTALLGLAWQGMQATRRWLDGQQALADARSGLEATYAEMRAQWALYSSWPLSPQAQSAMLALGMWIWSSSAFNGSNVSVGITLGNGNLPSGSQQSSTPAGYQYQLFQYTATASRGSVSKVLQTTIPLSNAFAATGFAVAAGNNLFLAGAPEVQGNLTANKLYVTDNGWYVNPNGSGPVGKGVVPAAYLGQTLYFAPEPAGSEPASKPLLDADARVYANGVYGFNQFTRTTYPIPWDLSGGTVATPVTLTSANWMTWLDGGRTVG